MQPKESAALQPAGPSAVLHCENCESKFLRRYFMEVDFSEIAFGLLKYTELA
jgi:hypothetical protein